MFIYKSIGERVLYYFRKFIGAVFNEVYDKDIVMYGKIMIN